MNHAAVVYRFFDADGRLLYIGCTSMGAFRWTYHATERPWWSEVATVTVAHFTARTDALAEEERAIREERPAYNRLVYARRPPSLGIKRRKNEGSIYQDPNNGHWHASIRLRGERFYFRGGRDRAVAEEWLRDFRAAHGLQDAA